MKTIFLIVLFLCMNRSVYAQNDIKSHSRKFRITGYLPGGESLLDDVKKIDLTKITHLNIAFLNPDSMGKFHPPHYLKKVARLAHKKEVQVLISIAGGSPPKYFPRLLMADKQNALIDNLTRLVTRYHLDGVDVDLEGPMINQNYESFVTNLKTSLQGKHKTMTAAIAGYYALQYTDAALEKFDFLNIMSYDKTGPWNPEKPGQHAPFSLAADDLIYWNKTRGISKEKLGVGLPFYGYGFGAGVPEDMSYRDIIKRYPDAENADEVKVREGGIIYYNGTATIKEKTKLALDSAGGVMIWQLLQDAPGKKSLLGIIDKQIALASVRPNDKK